MLKICPTVEQTWLLKAALLSDQEAWKRWTQQVDFDQIDPASFKLLPLVARNPALASLKAPIFEKCKGVYRQTWVNNHLNWGKLLSILAQLRDAGIDQIVLLKGMAMILHYYRDFGVRVIGDVDILIDRLKLPIADSLLRTSGWLPNVTRFNVNNPEHLKRWHALNFTHPTGMHLDIHWSLIQESGPAVDEIVLKSAQALSIKEMELYIPNPADLLMQTCVHGVKHSPVPLIRWIADAVTILKCSNREMDWERLVNLAKKAHVCLPLSLALQYLTEQFEAPIPSIVMQQLRGVSTLRLERLEYRFHVIGYQDLASWYRYCLNRGYLTTKSQLLHIHKYLQTTARLKSPWQIPFFALYWVLKRILRKVNYCFKRS